MTDRFQLIARKQAVRQQIERLRRRLEHERAHQPAGNQRRIGKLESELEHLMAEEHNLRVAIDRSQ